MAERRLERSRTERKIAGVCGGLARYMDADPVFVRLGLVAACFIPPFAAAAIVGYLAGWLIIPEEPEPAPPETGAPGGLSAETGEPVDPLSAARPGEGTPPPEARGAPFRMPPDASLVGGALFIAVGVFFLMVNLGMIPWEILRFWRWRYLWPMVVIALGVVMLVRAVQTARSRPDAP